MAPARKNEPKPPHDLRLGETLRPRTVGSEEFAGDLIIEDAVIADLALAGEAAEFAEISGSRFTGGSLADTDWHRSSLVDVALEGVDLANSRFVESLWRRVHLDRCRLTGVVLAGCIVEDAVITGSVLDFANLRFAQFTRVRFEGCTLTGADLVEAQLHDVSFEACDLSTVEFSQAHCQRVRIAGCRLDGLRGVGGLAGATIAPTDLLALTDQLAAALGIHVDWEG